MRLRPVAGTSSKRVDALDGMPTMIESGIGGYEVE
jgi:tripartite-type tricarboxylate transporter receptor subunit TctC